MHLFEDPVSRIVLVGFTQKAVTVALLPVVVVVGPIAAASVLIPPPPPLP